MKTLKILKLSSMCLVFFSLTVLLSCNDDISKDSYFVYFSPTQPHTRIGNVECTIGYSGEITNVEPLPAGTDITSMKIWFMTNHENEGVFVNGKEQQSGVTVFHSWKLGDRQRFLEGMYSIMVGSISQNTYISCEHRHAIQGSLFTFPLAFYLAKLSVIDDQVSFGDLYLMRLCPNAWISSEEDTYFEKMPTEFGPVNLRFRLSGDGKTLDVSFSANWREKPNKIILHVPQMPGLEKIIVNNKSYSGVKEINLMMKSS